MAKTSTTLTTEQLDDMAETIAKSIIGDRKPDDIAHLEQDEIDSKLFPLMQQLEDRVDERLTKIIEEVFEKHILVSGHGNWWDD